MDLQSFLCFLRRLAGAAAIGSFLALAACGGGGGGGNGALAQVTAVPPPGSTSPSTPSEPSSPPAAQPSIPQLAAATPATRQGCEALTQLVLPDATVTDAYIFKGINYAGGMAPLPRDADDCWVQATLNVRQGVNGSYANKFLLILPPEWNGRLFADPGGLVGSPTTTYEWALNNWKGTAYFQNFAVLSFTSFDERQDVDANHLGYDPQARIDFAYEAIGKVTGPARKIVEAAYAKLPDRMYIGGCTKDAGTRTLLAAGRYPAAYDGFLAVGPAVHQPQAGVQWAYEVQQFATIPVNASASGAGRALVAQRIVAKCDALDGAVDDMVLDVAACQAVFDLRSDVPGCATNTTPSDATCLNPVEKVALANVMFGAHDSSGARLYPNFPYDRGIASNWMSILGQDMNSATRTRGKLPLLFVTPPVQMTPELLQPYLLGFSMDIDAPKIYATGGGYAPSSMETMRPPTAAELAAVRDRGGKILVMHGTADSLYSVTDTTDWYDQLRAADPKTSTYARLFTVPGMAHCGDGIATDSFDAVSALVAWVEQGQAPDRIVAGLRPPAFSTNWTGVLVHGNYPATWSSGRTRPLCPYPQIARLKPGATDLESASSFVCQ